MNIIKRLFISFLVMIPFIVACTAASIFPSLAAAENAAPSREKIVINELLAYDAEIIKKDPAAFVEKLNKIGISAFSFYRGTAALFYRDMFDKSMDPVPECSEFSTDNLEKCYINGDLHIANFVFLKNNEDDIQFDANDFDESYISSYSLDLKRLLVSIILMADDTESKSGEKLANIFLESFIKKIKDFNDGDNAFKYCITAKNSKGYIHETIQSLNDKSRKEFLEKFTKMKKNNKFLENDELKPVSQEVSDKISSIFITQYIPQVIKRSQKKYEKGFFDVLDICEKLHSGTGSLGLKRYYILIGGNTPNDCEKNYIIEMKQERDSVVSAYASNQSLSQAFKTNARRALLGTCSMASYISAFVGIIEDGADSYLLREISPQKYSPSFEEMNQSDLEDLCETAGKIYAKMLVKCANPKLPPHTVQFLSKLEAGGGKDRFKECFINFALNYASIVKKDFEIYSKNKAALIEQFEARAAKSNFVK